MTHGRPLAGGNATRADHDATELLDRNETRRLELVRGRAEKWVAGLTALTGLLASVLIVKGPQSIRDLALPWRIVVALLLALALGALTFGTYRAHQSAHGDPGRVDEISQQPLTGLAERLTTARRQAARASQAHLRHAVVATLTAVALLALATGITWFAPTSTASSPGRACVLMDGKPVAEPAEESVTIRSHPDRAGSAGHHLDKLGVVKVGETASVNGLTSSGARGAVAVPGRSSPTSPTLG
jgi:hypothetical protein